VELDPAGIPRPVRFGRDFELDFRAYELRRSGRALKLERIPMELLLVLVERRGELVTREQIVERVWGPEVFVDVDNSVNTAIRKLRQVLRDDPEKPRYIQTVTGKGYRFIAPVVQAAAAADLASSPPPVSEPGAPRTDRPEAESPRVPAGSPSSRHRLIVIGLALALIAGVAVYLQQPRARLLRRRRMLAVLPFENLTGDPAQEYFSDGLTEEMIGRLGNVDPDRLAVIARTSVMHYRDRPSLDRIRRELGVDYVLEGSVRRDAERVRISAQLIQMSDQTHLWSRQYDRELSSLVAVQEEIAQAVADQIQLTLEPGNRTGGAPALLSPEGYEAYDLYLKGRYFWNLRTADGFGRAVLYFASAAEKDPAYARAYSGLADAYALMSTYDLGSPMELMPKARSAAIRALDLDDHLAEAHTSLALIREQFDWDWKSAEREFRRAIELGPNYATAHHWYAEFLAFQGRFGEALAESERASRLDPLSLIISTDHATILYFARQPDRAIEEFRSVLEREPRFLKANMVVWPYLQKGMYAEALAQVGKWRGMADDTWSWVAQIYVDARLGRNAGARQDLQRLEQWGRDHPSDPMPMLPAAYLGVGEKEKSLDSLERLFRERSSVIATLKVDPLFDPLREDPRFQELLRRAGLTK
jgi:TolB-like protein/DNA-binding winged helix-turn-helix (wHTH) protein/Tfp pilus assembly protein PilF